MTDNSLPEERDEKKRYVGGLPDMIHGNIVASRPKTMQDAIEMATELMDKKISTLAERQAENKRKLDNNNQAQQQSPKNKMWCKQHHNVHELKVRGLHSDRPRAKELRTMETKAEGTGARGNGVFIRGVRIRTRH
ncbi:hypothetical protein Tco_0554791 [Tanacetum coccineum]